MAKTQMPLGYCRECLACGEAPDNFDRLILLPNLVVVLEGELKECAQSYIGWVHGFCLASRLRSVPVRVV